MIASASAGGAQRSTPILLVVAGPPCSGKSTLARGIAAEGAMVHLELDTMRARLLPGEGSRKTARDVAYRALHALAEVLLGLGHSVILDATYGPAEHRLEVEQLALRTGAALHLIQCRVAPDVAVARFTSRDPGHPADDLTPSRVRRLALRYPLFDGGMVVDAAHVAESFGRSTLAHSLVAATAGWSAASIGRWP